VTPNSDKTRHHGETSAAAFPMKLTRDEIRLVVFILVALVLGAAVKNYRDKQRMAIPSPAPRVAPGTPAPADFE
jgi:hypothetical protein